MLEPDFKTKIKNDPKVVKHLEWAINIQEKHVKITSENIKTILKDEIGVTFSRVLEDAGVYKRNNEGEKGLLRFIEYINMNSFNFFENLMYNIENYFLRRIK